MDAKLVVVAGDAETTEVKLRLPAILGRGREATLTVPHPLVSRQHCEIFEKDRCLVVRDLGSLNGTFIGDERIDSEAVLRDGELLTVGTVTFRAVYLDDPNLSAPARQEDAPERASVADPAAAEQPANAPKPGIDPELETERVQPPAAAAAEEDGEFVEFLQTMDVEADSVDEEAAEIEFPPTIDSASPLASTELDEVEEADRVEEPAPVDDDFEPVGGAGSSGVDSDVQVEDVDELEEVGEVDDVEEVEIAEPAEAVGSDEPSAGVPVPASGTGEAESGRKPPDEEDEELQSFLRELDI